MDLSIPVMFYGVDMLPRLRRMKAAELRAITDAAQELSSQHPLHLCPQAQFEIPAWSDKKLSGGYVVALMVFGLWVMCGEDEKNAAPLVEAWPIREAVELVAAFETLPV